MCFKTRILLIFVIVFVSFTQSFCVAANCEIERNETEVCAYHQEEENEKFINCLLINRSLKAEMKCTALKEADCNKNGCLKAHLKVKILNDGDPRYFDLYNYTTFRWKVVNEKHHAAYSESEHEDDFKSINVTLSSIPNGVKESGIRIGNISEDSYEICVSLMSVDDKYHSDNLCCVIRTVEEIEESVKFYMPAVVIGILVLFYVTIILVHHFCPPSQFENVDDLLKALPSDHVDILKNLATNRPDEIRKRSTRRRTEIDGIPQEESVPGTSADGDYEDTMPSTSASRINIAYVNDDNTSQNDVVIDVDQIRPAASKRRVSIINPDILKPATKNANKRRKSVLLNPELFPEETEEERKKKETENRRKSLLLDKSFFLEAMHQSKKHVKFDNQQNDAERENIEVEDPDEIIIIAARREQKRRASVHPFQKAFTLEVSDSD